MVEVSRGKSQRLELSKLVPLMREIGNLKRIRDAQTKDSMAARMFERAWARIIGGEAVRSVAVTMIAEAIIAVNLGAIDAPILRSAEISDDDIETILVRAFESSASHLDVNLADELRFKISKTVREKKSDNDYQPVRFVENLKRQPRAGATKSGAPKSVFDQPENHAEHCLTVAVIGAILAVHFDADLETTFFAGLTHHFHNAYLPDSGFAGEESLGEFLPLIFQSFRHRCLEEVPENLHEKIWRIFEMIETADQPEAKAFHTADVFDRVLQMRHHAEANEFTLRYAMEETELVHAGPVQNFHYEVLQAAKLI